MSLEPWVLYACDLSLDLSKRRARACFVHFSLPAYEFGSARRNDGLPRSPVDEKVSACALSSPFSRESRAFDLELLSLILSFCREERELVFPRARARAPACASWKRQIERKNVGYGEKGRLASAWGIGVATIARGIGLRDGCDSR